MAGFSMCFQLIADEIVAKFKWIGDKIGFKKKENSEEDEDDDPEKKALDDANEKNKTSVI